MLRAVAQDAELHGTEAARVLDPQVQAHVHLEVLLVAEHLPAHRTRDLLALPVVLAQVQLVVRGRDVLPALLTRHYLLPTVHLALVRPEVGEVPQTLVALLQTLRVVGLLVRREQPLGREPLATGLAHLRGAFRVLSLHVATQRTLVRKHCRWTWRRGVSQ